MPSYKPKVQVLLNEEYHKKFKALCKKERRSDSIMGALMIEKYINEYEAEHGEIEIKEPTRADAKKEFKDTMEKRSKKEISHGKTVIESIKSGFKFGNAEE